MKNVADLYPLTPMQQLMLVHTLAAPTSDVLTSQIDFVLEGRLDVTAMQGAWEALMQRHMALRTAFVWDGLKQPLQVVRRQVTLPFVVEDWRFEAETGAPERLAAFLAADRARRFDPSQAPLMRLALFRLAEERFRLIWTSHHLILDRWCIGLVLSEVVAHYEALRSGQPAGASPGLPPSLSQYRDYVAWLQAQDEGKAASFWRETLAEATPTLLTAGSAGRGPYDSLDQIVDAGLTGRLQDVARRGQVTMNTILQGAWSLVLAAAGRRPEAIFGVTVSGRPPALPGVEGIIGSFINNLPLRVPIEPEAPLLTWLKQIQARQLAMQPFEHHSVAQIMSWSGWPANQPLFDSLLLFQAPVNWPGPADLALGVAGFTMQTRIPLTLAVEVGSAGLVLSLAYDRQRLPTDRVERLVAGLCRVLGAMVDQDNRPVAGLLALVEPAPGDDSPAIINQSPELQGGQASDAADSSRPLRRPVSPIEARLVRIWESLLQRSPLSVTDDFFELGGSSLQAMQLFSRIEHEFGLNLSLSTLLKGATVAQLAAAMEGDVEEPTWSSLVEIQPLGHRPPFFCVHGLTGDVLWFRRLGALMAPDQPFYGLEAVGLDGVSEPLRTIGAMATGYIDEIRSLQPEGPYYLGGASFGGTVALEMARQLRAQGHAVGLLASFDHAPPLTPASWARMRQAWRVAENLPFWLASLTELSGAQLQARTRRKARVALKRLWRPLSANGRVDSEDLLDYADALPTHRRRIIEINYEAISRYQAQPYAGPVTLFRARSQPLFGSQDPEDAWRRLAEGPLTVYLIPGSHEGMFHDPHVHRLAAALRAALNRPATPAI